MKLLLLLLLTSCALTPEAPKKPCNCKKKQRTHTAKMYICMREFSDKGFDSDALVKICKTIHERRR